MHDDGSVQQLIDGLTAGQLAGLVARLLDRMSGTEREEFSNSLDPDVAAVFRCMLAPPVAGTSAEESSGRTSDAKFTAQFHSALGAFRGLLSELGDEDGDYIHHEHDWDPPEFDASRLTEAIERCAKNLLPLLDRAAALGLEGENLFIELCREITAGIGQYPDHIYTEEGVLFDSTATECVLKWLDLHAETESEFLGSLVAFLDGTGCVSLNDDTIRTYLLEGCLDGRRGSFYRAIEDRRAVHDEFRRKTDKPHTLWHGIRYALACMFDVNTGIEIAEASVSDDWTKGVKLVADALANGKTARALEFCRKTVDSYYQWRSLGMHGTAFDPGTTSLIGRRGVRDDSSPIIRILGIWTDLSAKGGDKRLADLLSIQQVLFTRPDDWTAVRAAFKQAGTADSSALFSAWKKMTLEEQCGAYILGVPRQAGVWPEWLIVEGFAGRFDVFTAKALSWLGETFEAENRKGRDGPWHVAVHDWPPQMSLVAELFALGRSSGDYPTLRVMLSQYCQLTPCPARLEWLGRTDVAGLTASGLGFVQRNMATLIPSPESRAGDYEASAGWLAVAREVAPDIFLSTLSRWKLDYKRRRNLWRDLIKRGIDG